ncbi:hypothetical protein K505DRAFT_339221 [Melanomma pulvis-pyrius CBS 109.77]|uniref:Uncharacterized protein n=1 Tax=Melanomma pulvis-pyrius CBS 109.77 TaxID=1314802 RepID=A0A6A6X6V7_9PLEO|nr:hypothetical protein K505DRAFT_339221 [Melanomma pulvis-pyrius CBS 109.77]
MYRPWASLSGFTRRSRSHSPRTKPAHVSSKYSFNRIVRRPSGSLNQLGSPIPEFSATSSLSANSKDVTCAWAYPQRAAEEPRRSSAPSPTRNASFFSPTRTSYRPILSGLRRSSTPSQYVPTSIVLRRVEPRDVQSALEPWTVLHLLDARRQRLRPFYLSASPSSVIRCRKNGAFRNDPRRRKGAPNPTAMVVAEQIRTRALSQRRCRGQCLESTTISVSGTLTPRPQNRSFQTKLIMARKALRSSMENDARVEEFRSRNATRSQSLPDAGSRGRATKNKARPMVEKIYHPNGRPRTVGMMSTGLRVECQLEDTEGEVDEVPQ